MQQRPLAHVEVVVRDFFSPIHEDYRGTRLLAALPNNAGPFGKTSFRPPWFVHEKLYEGSESVKAFVDELYEMGYTPL